MTVNFRMCSRWVRSMGGQPLRWTLSVGLAVVALGASGCSGDSASTAKDAAVASATDAASTVPDALVQASWQVRMADQAVRQPFEDHGGWSQLFTRQHDSALGSFAADFVADGTQGRGLARVHLDYAAVYRQAAMLAARATMQVYGADRQDDDPVEVDYLLMASAALLGDCEAARTAQAELALPAGSPLTEPARWWQARLDACPALPGLPAPGTFPGQPSTAPQPGTLPDIGSNPHYVLSEQTAEARPVQAGDPTVLYLISLWHQQAALAAAPPEDAAVLGLLMAPWALPSEPSPSFDLPAMDDAWLFGAFALTPQDVVFLAAARRDGVAAVTAWQSSSPLAAALAPAIQDGKVVVDEVLDQGPVLGRQIQDAMAARAGQKEGFHRSFADLAVVSVLRAGQLVADANDQYRDAGILRINALERSTGPAADPLFMLSVAAWDTGNRNPLRAQDILHGLLGRFPDVQLARYPLDAMHIRLSRNAGPAEPAH